MRVGMRATAVKRAITKLMILPANCTGWVLLLSVLLPFNAAVAILVAAHSRVLLVGQMVHMEGWDFVLQVAGVLPDNSLGKRAYCCCFVSVV